MPKCMSWQYIAGFFDGEGCIYIRTPEKNVNPIVQLTIVQRADRSAVLYEIQDFLSRLDVKSTVRQQKDTRKVLPVNVLEITGRKGTVGFLEGVFPYLRVKRMKAQSAMGLLKSLFHNRQTRWLPSEIEEYCNLIETGLSIQEIARRLGRSAPALYHLKKRLTGQVLHPLSACHQFSLIH